ncbi:MAG: helix-turn-helix domain-containing protein [Candidatus Uhrbacteria bacterium]
MAFFVHNLKKEETLGEKLRALRKHHNWSLKEMAEITKIQKKFLEALELGKYEILPEPLYTKNYLKKYVAALRGDEKYFLSLFEEECRSCDLIAPHRLPVQKTRALAFFSVHRLRKIAVGFILFTALIIYLGWQINSLLSPPKIEIFAPQDNISVDNAIISVQGQVKKAAEIFVDGNQVLPNPEGRFTTTVTLERGLNVITIEAKTRHSKMVTIYRRVVLKQE